MKRILKGNEPATLVRFREACPSATWEEMRNDALHDGQNAYKDCRDQTIKDQWRLCAYCECKLNLDKHGACRVEHVIPKSMTTPAHNLHLDWRNIVATCDGGSKITPCDGEEPQGPQTIPLPENLSCDVSKKAHTIQIDPLSLPIFPNIFAFDKGTGYLAPDPALCVAAAVNPDNLKQTIEILNLNCERLARHRRKIVVDIDRRKKVLRQKNYTPQASELLLAKRYFNTKWPEFFTTIRCCLGKIAEDYLSSIGYEG